MKRILVVDDSVANLKFVERVLNDKFKLVMVKSGAIRLSLCRSSFEREVLLFT